MRTFTTSLVQVCSGSKRDMPNVLLAMDVFRQFCSFHSVQRTPSVWDADVGVLVTHTCDESE